MLGNMQVSAHSIHSKAFLRDIQEVFPAEKFSQPFVIATMQHAAMDLVRTGENVETEKDLLLEAFTAFSQSLCEKLVSSGLWADFIDPCSGLPV